MQDPVNNMNNKKTCVHYLHSYLELVIGSAEQPVELELRFKNSLAWTKFNSKFQTMIGGMKAVLQIQTSIPKLRIQNSYLSRNLGSEELLSLFRIWYLVQANSEFVVLFMILFMKLCMWNMQYISKNEAAQWNHQHLSIFIRTSFRFNASLRLKVVLKIFCKCFLLGSPFKFMINNLINMSQLT